MIDTLIKYASGPVIGSVIGYFTNYIAVKMLFRPYRQIKIFGIPLPLTPGIIPKRQSDMARAIGSAIGQTLFTSSDIEKTILSDENIKKISDWIIAKADTEKSINDIAVFLGDNIYAAAEKSPDVLADKMVFFYSVSCYMEKIPEMIADKIIIAAEDINVGKIITDIAKETIEEKKQSLGFFSFVLNDSMLNPLLEGFESKINIYIAENGKEKILPSIENIVSDYSQKPINELTAKMDREKVSETISQIIKNAAPSVLQSVLSGIDIAGTVEKKINDMDVRELERLCLSVMKKELGAIVNLGALIGFIIGIINSFI